MRQRKLKLFFYRENEHFVLPPDCPPLPRIPLLANTDEDGRCLEGLFDTTRDPGEADFIVFPYTLAPMLFRLRALYVRFLMHGLPYFHEYESKHVFHASHDRGQPFCTSALILTYDPRKSNSDDINLVTIPHAPGAHVLAKAPDFRFDRIKYDTCFIGTLSDPVRVQAIQSVGNAPGLRYFFHHPDTTDWEDKNTSYLHMDDKTKKRQLEDVYVNNMRKSWTVLCPRGMGSSSIRFFETLCMGRIPIHISDEYILPDADVIDYSRFCIDIPQSAAGVVGKVVSQWIGKKSREELESICREARSVWERHFDLSNPKKVLVRKLERYTPAEFPAHSPRAIIINKENGERTRTGYPKGHFRNFEIDNSESWLNRRLEFSKSPSAPDGAKQCNGVSCELEQQGVQFLFSAATQMPANAAVLAVGSGPGASSIILSSGLMASRNLGARLYCVDTWEGPDATENGTPYDTFLKNIRDARADLLIEPVRMESPAAAETFRDRSLDLVFIGDGRGREHCLEDLEAWFPKIKPGGSVIGHGYRPGEGNPVARAAREFARTHGLELVEPEGPCFFLFRKPPDTAVRPEAGRNEVHGATAC
jgi:predicted O-methyltransferase YrrM